MIFVNPSNSYRIPGRSLTANGHPCLRIGRLDVLTSTFMELFTSDVGWVTFCCLGSYVLKDLEPKHLEHMVYGSKAIREI